MLAPGIIGEKHRGLPCAGAYYGLRGFQEGADLGLAVGRPLDRVPVDAERDVVEEQPAVYVRYVDPPLDAVAERIQCAGQVLPVHSHVEREVVARPGGNAYERQTVRCCDHGHDCQRPIAAGDAEGICAAFCCCLGERGKALAGAQNDNVDTLLAGPLNESAALGRTPAGPGIHKQHRLSQAAGGVPSTMPQVLPGPFSR